MAYKASDKLTSAKEQLEAALESEDVSFTGVEEARAVLADL
jgi:hypothetical protein